MAADGLIVLGLDVSQTQANIQAELDGILNSTKTRKIILKTAIEKAETEKEIDAVVAKINKKTVKMGVEVDAKSVNSILAAQQKIASTQAKLNSQMQEYRNIAKDIGITLNKDTWNAFNHAVSSGDFTKANEILRSAKKQIEEYNAAVKKMNADTSVSRSVSSIVEQFSKLKDVSAETQKRVNLLKANLAQFENADNTQKKLSAYKRLQTMIESLNAELKNLGSAEKTQSGDLGIKKKIEDARSSLEIFKIKYDSIGDSAAAQKVTKAITELDAALEKVDADATGGKLKKQWDSVSIAVDNAKRAVSEYNATYGVKSENLNLLSGISSQADSLFASVSNSGMSGSGIDALKEKLRLAADEAKALKAELDKTATTDQNYQSLIDRIAALNKQFQQTKKDAKVFEDVNAIEQFRTSIEKARQKVAEYDKTYSAIKGNPALVQNLNDLKAKLEAVSTPSQFKAWNTEFEQFNTKVKEAGLHTQSLGDKLKTAFKNFASFFSASRLMYQAFSELKQMISNVKDLDAAMINLKKVTDETDASYDRFLTRATAKAKELGTTVVDLVDATTNFSRLGFSLSEAEELGQLATIYANVGDLSSIDDATNSMISTMKGFGIEAENASAILDKFNEVGNNFAISSGDIGEALQRSASSMAAANNTIDETIALITAANTVVQDATSVGTAFKTISMRIRGATTEMEQAGLDMEGMADSTATLRKEIMALSGVDIMIDDDTFKSTYQIIEELAAKWGELTDIQQASITELIAGKRQGNIISAVMENFDIAQDALNSSLESAGSAMKEYNTYLEGIEAKTNQFKAAFEALSLTVFNSDFLKGIIEFGTGAITVLDGIIEKLGGMGNALMLVASALVFLNLKSATALFTRLFNVISSGFGIIPKLKSMFETLALAWMEGKSAGGGFITTLKGAATALTGTASAATIATGAITAVVAVIGIAIAIYQNYKQKIEEARQAAEDAANSHNELAASMDEYKTKIISLREELDKGNLSEEEAYNKRKELISIQDELISRFGKEAEGISLVTGEINNQIDAINNLSKANWNDYKKENWDAIQRAQDMFLNFDPKDLDFWNEDIFGRITIELPSTNDIQKGINDLNLDIVPKDFSDHFVREVESAVDGIDFPDMLGDNFAWDAGDMSIYEILDVYNTLFETTERLGKQYFGENYEQYVGGMLSSYSEQINEINTAIDENREIFDTYVEGLLLYDETYSEVYGKVLAAQKEYQDALLSGDEEAAAAAVVKMSEAQVAWANAGWSNEAVNLYMQDFFDKFTEQSKNYQFEVELKAILADPDDTFGNYIKDTVDKFKDENGKVDLYEVLNTGIEYDQNPNKNSRRHTLPDDQQAYVGLKFAADEYGVSVEQLLVLLNKLGYIELENADVAQETARTYFDSIAQIRKSYDSLKSATENAVDAQVVMKGIFADNTHLSEDAYNALVTLAGGETNLAGCIDTTNGYLVTNAEGLQNVVKASEEALMTDLKLAQSHEKLNYHELVGQLHDVTNGVEDYDDATLNTISTILDQIDVTKQQIAQYKILEQQLLGVTNAFTEMENAQQIDEAADYTDDLAEMIQTLFDSYANNEFGTETFWTAFKALVPEDIYGQFEDAGDQIEAGWDYLNNVLSRYYSSDDGNISINFDNIKNFVTDGLNTAFGNSTVFTGTLENFELNPQINTLEEFAEAMNLTTTEAFALGNAISKYSADHEDFLSDLEVETLENQIYACDQAMAELLEKQTELGKAGKVGTDEWNTLQAEIDETKAKMDELRTSARENISAHITIDEEILEKQKEVDGLKADLETLDETDAEYEATMTNYTDAQNELATLLQQKYDLEAPTELTIQVALEQVQSEITATQTELDKIAEFDGKTYTAKAGVEQSEVDDLVNKISELENEQSQIMIYAGIDDESVLTSLETIQNFVIDDKGFNVTFDNYKTTRDRLVDVQNVLAGIKSKTIYVTTVTRTQSSRATGTAVVSGNAYESGSWGTPTDEKDALVGELGEELVVDPRTGTYQTVGTNGAEFVDLPKGAIVFNHQQTKEILKNRRINSRGIAYAQGNAHFTFLDRTYSLGKDSVPNSTKNSNVNVNVNVSGDIDLEEQLKETLDAMDEEISKIIASYEHDIFLLEKNNGSADEIVAIYKKMQQEVHNQAEEYRKLGLSENSEYIMDLQKQWWDYQDSIKEVIVAAYEDITSEYENAITLTENWLNQAIESANYSDISRYTNDIIGYYRDMQDTIHDEAEYYRSLGYSETSDEVSQLSDLWWDYQDAIVNATKDAWQQVVDNANDALDSIQGMYDSLKDAAQEYAEYGSITVDTLQDILSYGVENLAYLQDENGQLVINEENIQRVIAARTQQMAIETALNYIQQLRTALTNNDTVALLNLTTATSAAASSTWDLVYAQLQLLGLSDDQYNNALQRINVMRSLADSAVTSIGRIDTSAKEALEETSTALENLLKYVEEMIKQEVENQISALEDQIDKYREIVDLQKESLDLEREKDKYTKDVTEKTKSIAELQARIAMLDLDDSREAQAEKRKLQEQLAEEQADLAETQADHAYEATSDMLDNMADAYEKEKQKEIEILEDSISSAEKIYQLAIDRINNHWDTLYDDLINWNYQYGNTVQSELISAWNAASGAVQQYGSYLNAVAATQAQIAAFDASSGFTTVGTTGSYDTSGGQTMSRIKEIVAQMKANSQAHHNASTEEKARLNRENLDLGEELQRLIGRTVVRGDDGVWYLDKVGGAQLYSTYPYSTYHTGGIVGDDATPKQDEMFALLKKREAVFTEPQQEVVYRVLKADETIAGKLGISGGLYHSMNGSGYAEMQSHNAVMRDMQQAQAASGGNHVSQSIGDVTVPVHVMVTEKLDKSDIQRLSREIGNIAGEEIAGSFIRAGKGTLRGSRLRP
jgi:TP901 family phage tail tape measure protein